MNHPARIAAVLAALLIPFSLSGCFGGDGDDNDDNAGTTTEAVTVNFAGKVGDADATCGTTYNNIGTTGADFTLTDFRLYVSNVALKLADGSEVALDLDQDGTWQYENVALLDFENDCENGNPETNTQVAGEVTLESGQEPVGICFDIGIPFELNHADLATLPAPLNVSGLYWVWQAGHKFVGIDGVVNGDANYYVHVGSTGCSNAASNPNAAPDAECEYPNRPRICLDDFNASDDAVAIDVGALLSDADVTVNAAMPMSMSTGKSMAMNMGMGMSCMSGNSDINCAAVLPKLGIDFTYDNGVDEPVVYPAAAEQTVFSVITL